jgi:choline dehydrogenase-like flavoprotein
MITNYIAIAALKEPDMNNPRRQPGVGLQQIFCSSEGAEYNS